MRLFLRDENSGETREGDAALVKGSALSTYLWNEGNYSCDCNRAAFFAAAKNQPDPDSACNVGDNRYAVLICDGGKIVYADGSFAREGWRDASMREE